MLLNLREYHRPAADGGHGGLTRALELLARPAIRTVALAGGDMLIGSGDQTIEAVVDLQGLEDLYGLDTDPNAGALQAGAMMTRAELVGAGLALAQGDHPWSPLQMVAEAARRWGGNVQRNRATLGGALAAAVSNDPLIVVLLACDASVAFDTLAGSHRLPIAEFLADRVKILAEPAVITEVNVPLPPAAPTGYALTEVGRTPADAPIVVAAAAVGRKDGRCAYARLALGGVAETPVRLPEVEALLEGQLLSPELLAQAAARAAELVNPTGDFRGSAEYRKAMAGVLSERALRQAWERRA